MYKTKLQALCQQRRWGLPMYSSMKDGPAHDPRFKSSVSLNGLYFHSSVSCKSLKVAQDDAAMVAFLHFTSPPSAPGSLITTEPSPGELNPEETTQDSDKHSKSPEEAYVLDDVQFQYKSVLQRYAQSKHIDSPSYAYLQEGPAHTPCFKATVTVSGQPFESPSFYRSRKAAEHAAAGVALKSLSINEGDYCNSFYKSLLQELAQRENLSKPVYNTTKAGPPHQPTFFSTVEVDNEVFSGNPARSKKEAELKAAKVAYTCFASRLSNSICHSTDFDIHMEQNSLSPEDIKPAEASRGCEFESHHMVKAKAKGDGGRVGSYLLCNKVRVYPYLPDILSMPKGVTILPISENKWVAVSLEFPDEEADN